MLTIFKRLPLLHRALICLFAALIIMALFFLPDPAQLSQHRSNYQVGKLYSLPIDESLLNRSEVTTLPRVTRWENIVVRPGESAAVLFKRIGQSSGLLHRLIHSDPQINKQLSLLRPNDELFLDSINKIS